jgi:hypothetical protein
LTSGQGPFEGKRCGVRPGQRILKIPHPSCRHSRSDSLALACRDAESSVPTSESPFRVDGSLSRGSDQCVLRPLSEDVSSSSPSHVLQRKRETAISKWLRPLESETGFQTLGRARKPEVARSQLVFRKSTSRKMRAYTIESVSSE